MVTFYGQYHKDSGNWADIFERLVQLAIKTTDKLLEMVQLIKGVILPRSREYQKN